MLTELSLIACCTESLKMDSIKGVGASQGRRNHMHEENQFGKMPEEVGVFVKGFQ